MPLMSAPRLFPSLSGGLDQASYPLGCMRGAHASLGLQRDLEVVALDADAAAPARRDVAIQLGVALRQRPLVARAHPQPQQVPLALRLLQTD